MEMFLWSALPFFKGIKCSSSKKINLRCGIPGPSREGASSLGEAMLEAAIREVKEETGYDVQLTGTTGVYPFISSLNHPVIMFHFTGEVVGGLLQLGAGEIKDSRWVKLSDILANDSMEFRDAAVMRQIVENLKNGVQHSLELFHPSLLLTSSESHNHIS